MLYTLSLLFANPLVSYLLANADYIFGDGFCVPFSKSVAIIAAINAGAFIFEANMIFDKDLKTTLLQTQGNAYYSYLVFLMFMQYYHEFDLVKDFYYLHSIDKVRMLRIGNSEGYCQARTICNDAVACLMDLKEYDPTEKISQSRMYIISAIILALTMVPRIIAPFALSYYIYKLRKLQGELDQLISE